MPLKWSRGLGKLLTQAGSITLCCLAPLTPATGQITPVNKAVVDVSGQGRSAIQFSVLAV